MVKTLTDTDQIHAYMAKYFNLDPYRYEISPTGVVNTFASVRCENNQLRALSVKFGVSLDDFILKCENLKTLENMPHTVNGQLLLTMGKFNTLKHCAKEVHGDFRIMDCDQLASLEGFPSWVGHSITLGALNITSAELQYLPRHVLGSLHVFGCLYMRDLHGLSTQIDGDLDVRSTPIRSLDGLVHCGGQLIIDYRPELPLLRSLLAEKGVFILNRGGYMSDGHMIDARAISKTLNEFKGKGKSVMLNAAIALKKLGQSINPNASENPLQQNARW